MHINYIHTRTCWEQGFPLVYLFFRNCPRVSGKQNRSRFEPVTSAPGGEGFMRFLYKFCCACNRKHPEVTTLSEHRRHRDVYDGRSTHNKHKKIVMKDNKGFEAMTSGLRSVRFPTKLWGHTQCAGVSVLVVQLVGKSHLNGRTTVRGLDQAIKRQGVSLEVQLVCMWRKVEDKSVEIY